MKTFAIVWTEKYVTYVKAETVEEAQKIFESEDVELDTRTLETEIVGVDEEEG